MSRAGIAAAPDVHTLTGAYALDALTGTERDHCERHVAECPPCASEVAEFRATAARLAVVLAERPPQRLHGLVFAAVPRVRQDPPGPPGLTELRARLRAARRRAALAARRRAGDPAGR